LHHTPKVCHNRHMNIAADGTPERPWMAVHKDGRAHGFTWFSDAQILARLERGEQWVPFSAATLSAGRRAGRIALVETIAAEIAGEVEPQSTAA